MKITTTIISLVARTNIEKFVETQRAVSPLRRLNPVSWAVKNMPFIFQKCFQKMILPKPLFLKSTLNRISDISFFFPLFTYFQSNKGTKRSDLTKVIRADTQGQILLLRGLQKIRVHYKKPNELFL